MNWIVPRCPQKRSNHPSDSTLASSSEFSLDSEGIEMDLMRHIYSNLDHESSDFGAVISHIRTTCAPFTKGDLQQLDSAHAMIREGLKKMKKVIKHERRWAKLETPPQN